MLLRVGPQIQAVLWSELTNRPGYHVNHSQGGASVSFRDNDLACHAVGHRIRSQGADRLHPPMDEAAPRHHRIQLMGRDARNGAHVAIWPTCLMIEDMRSRGMGDEAKQSLIRSTTDFATFPIRSPSPVLRSNEGVEYLHDETVPRRKDGLNTSPCPEPRKMRTDNRTSSASRVGVMGCTSDPKDLTVPVDCTGAVTLR